MSKGDHEQQLFNEIGRQLQRAADMANAPPVIDHVCPNGPDCPDPQCIAARAARRWWIVTCAAARQRGAIGIFYVVQAQVLALDTADAERNFRCEYETQGPPIVVVQQEQRPR